MANQNEIDVVLTAELLAPLDAALTALETFAQDLPVLSAAEKAGLVKPPDAADGWMINMVTRSRQNLGLLARDFDPDNVQRDLDLDALLAPRELRLARVLDRVASARFLARSDAFAALLGARRAMRSAGVAGVDDDLSEGLQRFFRRSTDKAPPAPAPVPAASSNAAS